MRIAVSGTYSAGKTTTSLALSHLTGLPRTQARSMREILPDVMPGRRLEECTAVELLELGIVRYTERAVHESHAGDTFLSDGSALHEWVYGAVRAATGIVPTDDEGPAARSAQQDFLASAMEAFGAVVRRHTARAYDVFVHLPVEFPLAADGHRPVSERFRERSDHLLRTTLAALGIPCIVVGGTLEHRVERVVDELGLPRVTSVAAAVATAQAEMALLDVRPETARR
jgi:hypothetical protein